MSGLFLSLRDGTRLRREPPDSIVVQHESFTRRIADPSRAVIDALDAIGNPGADEDALAAAITAADGIHALARFYLLLRLLTSSRLLLRTVLQEGTAIATLSAISPSFAYSPLSLDPAKRYVVSRFAYVRARAGGWILESPLSHARLALHDVRALAALHGLCGPTTAQQFVTAAEGLQPEAAEQLGLLLLCAGMLTELSLSGETLEDDSHVLRSWEFHDLLFHSRSRVGRHDEPTGATYRFAGRIDPPPPVRLAAGATLIPLQRPSEQDLEREPPLASIMNARRSIRTYGTPLITSAQVGEFLYRTARVTQRFELEVTTPGPPVKMAFTRRPYPAGGALYELEIYPVVNACEGLPAGLYHYDPLQHALAHVSDPTASTEALLQGASYSTGIPVNQLQILLVITSRFQRLSWKYSSIAYAATLKHVGVLFQTMYLVATAMQLAPCGVGCGDSDLFARAAGTAYVEETSVGEFLLGSSDGRI